MSLSTRKMLEELAGEVESAVEQERFSVADERFKEVLQLHKTLLLASAADTDDVSGNAATIGSSAYSWGDSSFNMEWLRPYRDIARLAVNHFDDDARLFNRVSYVPASIAGTLPSRPEKLLIDAQLIGKNLAYRLAEWWIRKADDNLLSHDISVSGTLPPPLKKVYESAMIAFVGHWDSLRLHIKIQAELGDSKAWSLYASGALVYAAHIENSAELLLKAVSRGDETASVWLFETFLKWWGNREFELRCRDGLFDYRARNATIGLASKSWLEARELLWDGSLPASLEVGREALNLSIRRFWESMRLLVALLLVENVGINPSNDNRELRFAAALVTGESQERGGRVEVQPLASVDEFLEALLRELFAIGTAIGRLDHFAERLSWDKDAPVVAGWSYGWTSSLDGLASMGQSQALILVSLVATARPQVIRSKRLIERWWKDVGKLETVDRYLRDMRRVVLSKSFEELVPATSILQSRFATSLRIRSARLAIARVVRQLSVIAQRERRLAMKAFGIDAEKVRALGAQIAEVAFDGGAPNAPVDGLAFVPGLPLRNWTYRFDDYSKYFLKHIETGADSALAEQVGKTVRQCIVAWSFAAAVDFEGLEPLNSAVLRGDWDASLDERHAFIIAVSKRCATIRDRGEEPVILVGHSAAGMYLHADRWGSSAWQTEPPASVTIRHGAGGGEIAFVDNWPVFDFDTPNGDCYVVSRALLRSLTVSGSNARDAMGITWVQAKEDRLVFTLTWSSAFRG
ncbi:hypothetical protein AWB79_05431 [Caballeronia hypogeia]|uniref:Uncharacterized protein n=2 Tax=Caballeronia hypogeia TaxID=1777140 RepID=A0A158CIG4_9BURK|nr:hypothetical protein AWB79_05431 [Caballeronia hypogeia]